MWVSFESPEKTTGNQKEIRENQAKLRFICCLPRQFSVQLLPLHYKGLAVEW